MDDDVARLLTEPSGLDSRPILAALNPPAGPYALFHHLVHAGERCKDVRLIYERMCDQRAQMSVVKAALRHPANDDGQADSEGARALVRQDLSLTHRLRVDYESLFHFGSVLLDQLAHSAGYLAGIPSPAEYTFHRMVLALDEPAVPPALVSVRDTLRPEARWLHFLDAFLSQRFRRACRSAMAAFDDRRRRRRRLCIVYSVPAGVG